MKSKNMAAPACAVFCALALAENGAQAQPRNLFVGSVGATVLYELSHGNQTTFGSGLNSPSGLAFDTSGNLFEADESGNIFEWAGAGTNMTTFASGLNNPAFMAIDAWGDVFVNLNGGQIDEFNPAGALVNTIPGITSSGMSGMAFDKAGNLYVATINGGGQGAGFIAKITPDGVQSTYAAGLNYPVGIAFNAAGDLFVCNGNLNGTITKIEPNGSQSTFATGLNNPAELAFDKSGDLFVADIGSYGGDGDITEIAASGKIKKVLSTSVGAPATRPFRENFCLSGSLDLSIRRAEPAPLIINLALRGRAAPSLLFQ